MAEEKASRKFSPKMLKLATGMFREASRANTQLRRGCFPTAMELKLVTS
jgi:hypothetical protein